MRCIRSATLGVLLLLVPSIWSLGDDSSPCCFCSAAPACSNVLGEETETTTGHLLDSCAPIVEKSLGDACDGSSAASFSVQPEFVRCALLSEPLVWVAFNDGDACAVCPEACALILALQGLALEFGDTASCSQTLLLLIRAFSSLERLELHWLEGSLLKLGLLVDIRKAECAAERRRELEQVVLPAWAGPLRLEGGQGGAKIADQVAVLIAATPSMLHVYQPFINLWRCYAWRHGLAFVLETDDTEVSPPHQRAPNWMRWFAARRHLPFYRALLVVDPDEFVVPECWNISIPAVLRAWTADADRWPAPDVAMRDFGRPQTLNNGVVLLRNSPRGVFFLDHLLDKVAWMQTIEKDQGAFDETVLEVLGLEARARGEEGYDSECAKHVFPNARGNHEVALYVLCWWRVSERWGGPFGARGSTVIHFADPRLADVNHVVGARGLAEPAILHHFAGRSKDWNEMLEQFGMSRRATADCRQVYDHVDAMAAQHSCVPGAEAVWPGVRCMPFLRPIDERGSDGEGSGGEEGVLPTEKVENDEEGESEPRTEFDVSLDAEEFVEEVTEYLALQVFYVEFQRVSGYRTDHRKVTWRTLYRSPLC